MNSDGFDIQLTDNKIWMFLSLHFIQNEVIKIKIKVEKKVSV